MEKCKAFMQVNKVNYYFYDLPGTYCLVDWKIKAQSFGGDTVISYVTPKITFAMIMVPISLFEEQKSLILLFKNITLEL